MKCEKIQEIFPDYLAGELNTQDMAQLEQHLSGCVTCQQELAQVQQMWQQLAQIPDEAPSPFMVQRFSLFQNTYSDFPLSSVFSSPSLAKEGCPAKGRTGRSVFCPTVLF